MARALSRRGGAAANAALVASTSAIAALVAASALTAQASGGPLRNAAMAAQTWGAASGLTARAGGVSLWSAAAGTLVPASLASRPAPPDRDYLVFVASEGNDQISLVRFGPAGIRVERQHRIGTNPTEPQGPHGLAVDAPGGAYYVSTAHGTPNGVLWKFRAADDRQLGRIELGRFPATAQVSPDGSYVWVVNFNLHGEMTPSSVSVVYGDQMAEVARIPTCVMPHGSRLSPDGKRHYSACMMDDVLIEVDAERMVVARHFMLGKGSEHGMPGPTGGMSHGEPTCSPTWAQPSADGRTVWAACNRSNDLVEIDVESWALRRRIRAGDGVYNLAVSRDGRLVVATNKRGQSVSVFEAATGEELARIATARRNPSGLVISPDGRYAFVTVEGVGAEPGTVEVIDLSALERVASVDVGQQAGGIDFWKTEGAGSR